MLIQETQIGTQKQRASASNGPTRQEPTKNATAVQTRIQTLCARTDIDCAPRVASSIVLDEPCGDVVGTGRRSARVAPPGAVALWRPGRHH